LEPDGWPTWIGITNAAEYASMQIAEVTCRDVQIFEGTWQLNFHPHGD
jgi:hypothetical protein